MNKGFEILLIASLLGGSCATAANAATATFRQEVSTPSPEAIAAGAPEGAVVIDKFVTTDADILSIRVFDSMALPDLFNVNPPFGSNHNPPVPEFINLNRALEVDSWVTTPGNNHPLTGCDCSGPSVDLLRGDLSDDGPQTDFHFLRFTFPQGVPNLIVGQVVVRGSTEPELHRFTIPEPSSLVLTVFAVCGLLSSTRNRSQTAS